jgi:RNase P subunit RPR2
MIEHHLHRVTRPAHATGGHQHHRAVLSDGSVKVSFWRCASGAAPLHACPSEPDPLARLIVKVAEARAKVEAKAVTKVRTCPRCTERLPFPDRTYWQPITKRGRPAWFPYCRACNAERRRPTRYGVADDAA